MATGIPFPFPAPVNGINTREAVGALQPTEARSLENWFPFGTSLRQRNGRAVSSSGMGSSPVLTLDVYQGESSQKLIAVSDGTIWDASGTTASSLYAGSYTDSRFQTAMYNGYMYGVNGIDTPWSYNGSTVGALGWTGTALTLSNLVNVAYVRNRVWFCEKSRARVWYGGIGDISGTLTAFDLGQVAGGGYCMAIGSWSRDAGDGMDDQTVFIMSTGEIIIYEGDPGGTFSKIGAYNGPEPIGRQCYTRVGGELIIWTKAGLIPITAYLSGIAYDARAYGNHGKVAPSLTSDWQSYSSNTQWAIGQAEGAIYLSVPVIDGSSHKIWVMNTRNGAWTTYPNFPAPCMAELNGTLYFGGYGGQVYSHTGNDDDGDPIIMRARGAYVAPNAANKMKADAVALDMTVTGDLSGRVGFDVDFNENALPTGQAIISQSINTTPWGSSWGSPWGRKNQFPGQYIGTLGYGQFFGLALEAYGNSDQVEWYGARALMTPSGAL